MKRIKDGDGVFQLVVQGVLVPVERVEGGDLDPVPERLVPLLEPGGVDLSRPARDQVQQAGPDLPFRIPGEVDHPGQRLGATLLGGDVVPVGSARGAVTTLLPFRFPGPPAEPGVRLSPHRALHVRVVVQLVVAEGVHGVGIR